MKNNFSVRNPNVFIPLGSHGFYLPTIRLWNIFSKKIREDMKKDYVFIGSIEDYIFDGGENRCNHCENQMKRTLLEANRYFNGGSIFCSNSLADNHPKEYWAEVWPDASSNLDNIDYRIMENSQRVINSFKLSVMCNSNGLYPTPTQTARATIT